MIPAAMVEVILSNPKMDKKKFDSDINSSPRVFGKTPHKVCRKLRIYESIQILENMKEKKLAKTNKKTFKGIFSDDFRKFGEKTSIQGQPSGESIKSFLKNFRTCYSFRGLLRR